MKKGAENSMGRNFDAVRVVALTVVMLAGCAASPYRLPGTEKVPLGSMAIVKSGPRDATYLVSIDGQKVPHTILPVERWELAAGEHAVVIGLRTNTRFHADTLPMRFVALPGKTYVIQYEVGASGGGGMWRGWIEDESGATVSLPDTRRPRAVGK